MIRLSTAALLTAFALPLAAQNRGSTDFQWAKALAAGSTVSIHNINGDIKVTPSTSGRVEVVGIRRGNGRNSDRIKAEVKETSRGIVICVLMEDTDSSCDENGLHSHSSSRRSIWNRRDDDWSDAEMSIEVAVPTNLTVRPNTVSGDISVLGAHGDLTANSVSGDIYFDRVHASSMKANTVSGDVVVRVEELTGRGDFSFNSVSGDVTLELPRDFGADLSMSTVSGDINTDFPITIGDGRMNRRSLNARIGAGGRRLEVSTVSGDLKLRMNSK